MQRERRFERKKLSLPGKIRGADADAAFDCAIVDLSPGGAKIELNRSFEKGASVFLEIGNLGEYPASVAWSNRPHTGLKFDKDPDTMAEVILAVAMYG